MTFTAHLFLCLHKSSDVFRNHGGITQLFYRGQVSRHLWKRGQASRRQKFDARLLHELRYGYLERTKSIETPVFQRFSSNLPTNTSNLLKNYVYMRYFTKYSYFTFKDILQ